jgi:beta-glucosidase
LGNGLADVLFGDYNPSGKLVLTWPKSITDLPPIADYDVTNNRTYMYSNATPLYPFGYGLSYTAFDYKNISLQKGEGETITVSFDITNSGKFDGEEVVQLYVEYFNEPLSRKVKQLKAFEKVNVLKGETKSLNIILHTNEVVDGKINKKEPTILIGSSSQDIRLKSTKF